MAQRKEDWQWWADALKGQAGPIHEGDPQCGYYRMQDRQSGRWIGVAIWRQEEEGPDKNKIVGAVGATRKATATVAENVWTWVAKNPVSYADYSAWLREGLWPDDPGEASETVARKQEIDAAFGSNLPPDPAARGPRS